MYTTPPPSSAGLFSTAKSRTQALFSTRRPWRELFAHLSSYSLPYDATEFRHRLRSNLSHFRVNYAMVVLAILFLSLVYHPLSMIVFLAVFVFWFVLYFFRSGPMVVLNCAVDDRVVLIGLTLVTVVSLGLTGVGMKVLVALLIGAAVVVAHAALRVAEDLFLDEDEIADGGMPSVVGA